MDIAIWISAGALAVSMVLPLYLDSRLSPRVSVRTSRLVQLDQEWNATEYYVVSAINHGRSEVLINQVNISFTEKGGHGREVFVALLDFKLGPSLPHRLGPYSDTYFGVTVEQVDIKLGEPKQHRIRGSLNLSSGYRVVSRRGLLLGKEKKLGRQHPRLNHMKLLVFAKEKSRMR